MRWTDLLRPERAFAAVMKIFLGLFVLLLVSQLVFVGLSQITLSVGDSFGMLVGLGLLSVIAYIIRERRKRERPRPRSTRGAERTPLLPPMEEDQ